MESEIGNAFTLLCDSHKLNRDKGLEQLQKYIQSLPKEASTTEVPKFEVLIRETLTDTENESWERKFGAFEAGKVLLQFSLATHELRTLMMNHALDCIHHEEFRVRIAAGEFLGSLCQHHSPDIYSVVEPKLMDSIKSNLERGQLRADIGTGEYSTPNEDPEETTVRLAKDAAEIFHDTAGWRCLETSMKGLQAVIEGCGRDFMKFLTQGLLDLIFETLEHTNRFVRETGYYVCAALVRYGITSSDEAFIKEVTGIENLGTQLASHLRRGLSDNWSQVRMAASVATRQFFMDIDDENQHSYFQILLPPLCLNRYYLAEGVRIYNQDTWKLVTKDNGKILVEKFIKEIISFYVDQTKSDNHAVREAACHCMEELSCKVEKSVVEPYILQLLDALLICFQDQSWPVRDTACVACGNFTAAFPDYCKDQLDQLLPLFFNNLSDPISSVRQGGAIALSNVFKAYGRAVSGKIMDKIKEGLNNVANQRESAERFEGFIKGPGSYSVTKQLRDNDPNLHSNQQMYSCGSLAPKMKRGGCSDCEVHRPSEPWEIADGCFCLIGELSSLAEARTDVMKCLPAFSKAAMHSHYHQHVYLLETFCKTVVSIARGFGKQKFKGCFELLIDPIFSSLRSENQLAKAAALDCLEVLSGIMGPQILRGRIEAYDPVFLTLYDRDVSF